MALTPGFKKFVGIVGAVIVLGGGYFYWKQMPHPAPVIQQEQVVEAPVQQAAPPQQAEQEPVSEPVQEAPRQAPQPNTSSNRGMSAVLDAGRK